MLEWDGFLLRFNFIINLFLVKLNYNWILKLFFNLKKKSKKRENNSQSRILFWQWGSLLSEISFCKNNSQPNKIVPCRINWWLHFKLLGVRGGGITNAKHSSPNVFPECLFTLWRNENLFSFLNSNAFWINGLLAQVFIIITILLIIFERVKYTDFKKKSHLKSKENNCGKSKMYPNRKKYDLERKLPLHSKTLR